MGKSQILIQISLPHPCGFASPILYTQTYILTDIFFNLNCYKFDFLNIVSFWKGFIVMPLLFYII